MNKLTQREIEVIKLVAVGYTNPEIASQLNISIHTVKAHLEKIYFKLAIHNRAQAAFYAVKNNIVE